MRRSLTREERIRRYADFRRVFQSGTKCECWGLRLLYVKNSRDTSRVAIVAGRSYRTAPLRNHAKRLMREVFRKAKSSLRVGYDLVLIPYPGAFSYSDRSRQFYTVIRKASLLRPWQVS